MSTLTAKILDDKLEREKEYWIQKLSGKLVIASLPPDFRKADSNGHAKGSAQIQIDAETETRLRRICVDSEALIFAALVAALKVCLHKYTGHEDIIVGTTIHERYRETASFNKLLALRTQVTGEMTARQLLVTVKDTLSEAYRHQKYPFEKLLEYLNGNHERNGSPLFQVVITLDNINRREHLDHLQNDLTFVFSLDGELKGSIEYATQLFRKETIELFAKHYHEILRTLVSSPEMEIARLELLSAAEKQQLIFDYNQSARPYPKHKTIHQLFEEQVERMPQARAATFAQQHLTYRELNHRANQLAHHLQKLGVEPGARVGIYLAHSLETLIAILGVLKAGAAYVPFDPDHPLARLNFMIEDAGISIVLTESGLAERLATTNNIRPISLDVDWGEIASESGQNPAPRATPEDLAYVIYTSGSTGTPKGVKLQHHALVNYIWWAKDTYLQDEKLDFPLYSSLAFDLTITSIYTPLITGNRVVVYRPDPWQSPVTEILKDDQVGVLKLTPSHLALIKDADNSQCRVKRLIVGGEAFESELARQVYESFGRQVEIYNEYGPTEATVGCMIYRFDPAQVELASVPIGRPAANVQIYILDEQLLPVAENVIGELYISGDGLASGYLNRDDLTAESFISNPFRPEHRMYRTKDLARWLPDRQIDYIGRKDEQVKFHGYRVELNEIRSVLNRYAGLRDSVVLVRKKPGHGNDLMIAYYAARQEIEPRLLRDFMAQSIIKETIPNVFVHLKKLPLTLNGKVNIEALPEIEESRAQTKHRYLAARTPVEAALASIWEETLGFKQVGIEDNFFELGGHSLLATQLMSHVREVFQVELQLRSLFAEPTVKGLAKKIEEQMKPERRLSEPPIVPVSRAQSLPLSFAQQRMWFFDQLEPGSAFYNVPLAVRLKGTLDVPVLERTLNEIIRRHESLRTTFATIDRQPVQIISSPSPLTLHLQDLSHLAEQDRESEARQLADEEAQVPFDLQQGPLLRVKLLRLSDNEHVVLLTMHHVISDGWSIGLLFKEVTALYDVYSRGESSTLAELPIQYADFAVWQRNWLQGEALEERLEYWRQHLAGAPPFLELPFSHAQPTDQVAPRGEKIPITLDAHLAEGLRALSRREGVTLFMTLLAAWQALLARYSGQDHIVTGTAIANRNRAETEKLIGFFVNTLALHTDLSGDPTFLQLLERVKDVCLGAYSHQDVPFEKVVEELQPERSLTHTPLFQVMFILQNAPAEAPQAQGLTLKLMDGDSGTSQFILLLDLEETGNRISGALRYNTDLFEQSMIEHMVGHFQTLLESVVADAEQRLSALPFLTPDKREKLLDQCNGENVSRPAVCLHELFEKQVAATPDAVAVRFEAERLTYRELNEQANQLARHLRVLGVRPEVRVGICFDRSPAMIVGLLGILKAGGAYVPLDPAYPQERLAFMLEDAQVHILLTQEHLLKLFDDVVIKSVCLDRDWETIAQYGSENLRSGVDGQNLAYVIYTSGSTGKPKGVMVQQHSIVNYTEAASHNFELQTTDCVLQFASISFDAAMEEIFPCLTRGATLALRTDDMLSSAATFLRTCEELSITIMDLPTAYWQQIASELARSNLSLPKSLRLVIIGGEEALPERVSLWQKHTRQPVKLLNTYGPTEATIVATACDLTRLICDDPLLTEAPIGRAIQNLHAYVLDRHLELCPAGVVGELYIGGAGLARGYLNRPDLTAEKFIPNPFSTDGGDRLYRSGDIARYRVDGQILFVGRVDEQVKIRGFRVELQEIASVLNDHDAVQDAVVVAHEEESGSKVLVAYAVTSPEAIPLIRQYVQQRLPDYMTPSIFIAIDSLPLLPNGKLDRRALPQPKHQRSAESGGYVAAQTALEDMLVDIWTEVLGVEQVGVNDNFFNLGGHSLLATQIVSRVREVFGVEIALRKLFEMPTVIALAKNIENAFGAAHGDIAPSIERVSRDAASPLSFAQQRLWFIDQLEPGTPLYNVPAAVRLSGKLDVAALQQTLDEVVLRHEALRTTFVSADGAPVQVIGPPVPVSLPVIDLSLMPQAEREKEAHRLAEEEAQRAFDLSHGPLLRTQLLRLGTEEHALLLTMHHIVTDGWSMGIFVKEVVTLYEAFLQGAPSPLPELNVQYADFAHWQRHWLQGEVLDRQLSYWRDQLSGAPSLLELPIDRPRPPVQNFRGAHHSFTLNVELSEQLRQLSRSKGVTLFMTLLAAYQTLLWRYSGERDIVVGADVANRNRHETEALIGFFVNMLVLRTKIDSEESFSELLNQVREVCLGAYAHQDLPFEKLVEELEPKRSLSHTPLFQVAFTFEKGLGAAKNLASLSLSSMNIGREISQFDLTLGMVGDGDELAGTLGYNTDLFETATIERMARHLVTLLEAIVANPEDKISELVLLPEDEGQQLLVEFNETAKQFPLDRCVHQLFEAQVNETPNAVAVEFEGERLTYRELNNRANQLARNLSELAVGPEILVALMARRSLNFLTAVLAIFKAGGAYVPLDPLHPARRLAQVLSRSRSSLILAADEFGDVISQALDGVALEERPQLSLLDDLLEREAPDENLAIQNAPGNLAYVIYTSGSTGPPKGAMLEQRGMCNHLWSKVASLQLTQGDVVAQTASQNFDVSVWQMLAVLIVGGRVFIAGDDLARDAIGQLEMVAKEGVTILEIVPSQLRVMVEEMGSTPSAARPDLSPLKWLIVNGEALTPELCRQWFSIYPDTRLINAYGPTECSDDVTQYVIERSPSPTAMRMPIGAPLPNMRMYVLDKKLSPAPLGVPDELYIGGIGVGRGYLGEPARTAEIYVPDCFGKQPGARLYKTGDRVRWLPDGNLDFLERIDHQVKLRGYRIELGEIEAALGQHDDVKECVVIVREDVPGLQKLTAYFVAEQTAIPAASELSRHLKERLPEYMIPSAFVQLTELPLNSNGKLDRRALPRPDVARSELDQNYVPSRTFVEELLVGMWREVLRVDQVGIEDDFFKLGGHSLLATQLMSRVRKTFGVEVPLRQLFESPTVAELAPHIEQSLATGNDAASTFSSLVKIQSGNATPPFFCVHPSGGNVLCYAALAHHLGPQQAFYGLQSWGLGSVNVPHTTIEEMANHYLNEMRTVQPHGPYFLGGWSMGGVVAFEIAHQLRVQGEQVGLLALIDSQAPAPAPHISEIGELALMESFARDMGLDLESPDLEVDQLQRLFQLFKINFGAMLSYLPQGKQERITLLRTAEDPTRNGHHQADGWESFATEVEVHFVEGDHFNMVREPFVQTLASQLRTSLDAAFEETLTTETQRHRARGQFK